MCWVWGFLIIIFTNASKIFFFYITLTSSSEGLYSSRKVASGQLVSTAVFITNLNQWFEFKIIYWKDEFSQQTLLQKTKIWYVAHFKKHFYSYFTCPLTVIVIFFYFTKGPFIPILCKLHITTTRLKWTIQSSHLINETVGKFTDKKS